MAHIKSRKHQNSTRLLALVAATVPVAVAAQTSETMLPSMTVKAGAEVPYKAEKSASQKFTQPLVDTPQTVQVIKKEILQEQGAATLMDALRNTPGITMQLGENGNTSAGDTFQMRGFSTQTATFVDGIRDLGAVTRDVYNLEQVEVVKGPAGTDIGRGAGSGYINLISKLPSLDSLNQASVAYGTEDKKRLTADINQKIGDGTAFRINAMAAEGGVDGRDVVKNKSYAIAPAIAFGLNSPTRIYLYSQHIRQDNVPDGGIPTIGLPGFYNATAQLRNGARVNRENFYGSTSDYEKVDADMITAKIEHDFGDGSVLRNLTRYGKTSMDRVLTGVNGLTAANVNDPSSWTVARTRQRTDQVNEIVANQTTLNTEFKTGGVQHSLVTGLELLHEKQDARSFSTTGVTIPAASLYNPNPNVSLPTPYDAGAFTNGSTNTIAAFVFDTLKFNDRFQLNGGLRVDNYKTKTNSATVTQNSTTGAVTARTPFAGEQSDTLVSWKVGALYKPATNGSVYAAYSTSLTPPGSANFALSSSATNQAFAGMDPQETKNTEIGTKWELLNKRLNVSAAWYRTDNDKQVSYNAIDNTYSQFGKTRVEGVELAAVGQLTNFWQVSAGLATMKTKALDNYSLNTTTGVVTQSGGVRWSPELTATLWSSYTWGDFTLGGGARYVSEQKRLITGDNPATQNLPNIPSYWVADMMAAYKVAKNVNVRLNVYNLFDKDYLSTLNNSGARATLGTPRSAMLTANFQF